MARACELPEQAGRSLSQWDCAELARQLVRDAVVLAIQAASTWVQQGIDVCMNRFNANTGKESS